MFGVKKKKVELIARKRAIAETIAVHNRIGTRLFGKENRECLNLRCETESDNFDSTGFLDDTTHNIIGKMINRIVNLEEEIARLNQNEAIIGKAQVKE